MDIEKKDIEIIVQRVVKDMLSKPKRAIHTYNLGENPKAETLEDYSYGVFSTMEEAINSAFEAQKKYTKTFQLKDREHLIKKIREITLTNVTRLAKMVHEETKIGRYEDKVEKHIMVIEKTPGTECLETKAISGDSGLTIIEHAPFGLIGAITPVTNPTETIINNVISMIAGGNGVVFNVHPSAKICCAYCIQLINKAIEEAGGPRNLVTMVKEPTMTTIKELCESDKIKLIVGTGGTSMVNSLLKSGKKVIGAGAGNPPAIVDETADLVRAAQQLFLGASFDNNLLCLAEKEVFVVESVVTDFIYNMINEGAFLLNKDQLHKIMNLVLTYDGATSKYYVNKKWVGQDAGKILQEIGINNKSHCKLIICEVKHDHPFVLIEQMMPILPIVQCENLDEAIKYAVISEHGNRHTASMFSKNVDNLTRFAREIETTIFVKNAATLSGVGLDGEGHTTMTIAGPTGEGITNAVSFTRQRRCTLADGGFRII